MRSGRILGGLLVGAVALAVLALLGIWLVVNPNDYKPRIAAAVKHATGRDLLLQGNIRLSVFPWIALDLGPATLGNPPGFPGAPLITLQSAALRLRLLPLLAKRLEVGRIDVDGLDVHLARNAAGRGNWQGPAERAAPAAAPAAPQTPAAAAGGETLAGVAGLHLTRARVSYRNVTLQNVELETGSFAEHGVVPVMLHVDADRGIPGEQAGIDAHFDLSAAGGDQITVAALRLNIALSRADHVRSENLDLAAPTATLNLGQPTLLIPAVTVTAAGATLTGRISAAQINDAPQVTGTFVLAPLVVREWLARMGVAVPATRDPKALSSVAAAGDFAYAGDSARVDHLRATLDDTHLTGSLALQMRDTPSLTFALAVDGIDVDRYLPPATQTPAVASAAPAPAAAQPSDSPPLAANGTLSVGTVRFAPLQLANVTLSVATHDRVMRVHPLSAEVDGGQYSGDVTIDNRTSPPVVSFDEHLTGIDVGRLLAGHPSLRVSGKGDVDLEATGRGVGADAILKSLNGRFDASVADGALEGIDLDYELARAAALLSKDAKPIRADAKRTPFGALKLSAQITDGVAATHDLVISSSLLKITGQGTANIPTQALDFALLADARAGAGAAPLQLPVSVTGSFTEPRVRPDLAALAKGELRYRVRDALRDKLQGLFGKP